MRWAARRTNLMGIYGSCLLAMQGTAQILRATARKRQAGSPRKQASLHLQATCSKGSKHRMESGTSRTDLGVTSTLGNRIEVGAVQAPPERKEEEAADQAVSPAALSWGQATGRVLRMTLRPSW